MSNYDRGVIVGVALMFFCDFIIIFVSPWWLELLIFLPVSLWILARYDRVQPGQSDE